MPKMISVVSISVVCIGALASNPSRVEIARDVFMPVINHGSGNQTLWLEVGGRGMDTAYDYAHANQQNVAKAIKSGLVSRSDAFVTTKIPCCPSGFFGYGSSRCNDKSVNIWSPKEEITKALEFEGVDSVDLLLLHWPCDQMEDSVAVYKIMEKALGEGKARAIGVSNFNASALEALISQTTIKPAVTQNAYSIGNHFDSYMGNDDKTWNYCKKHGITLSAWSPLGGISGKGSSIFSNAVVNSIARSHGKSVAQIALRWLVQRGIMPVTAGEDPEHLREDVDVFTFNLSADEMARLTAIGEELTLLYM